MSFSARSAQPLPFFEQILFEFSSHVLENGWDDALLVGPLKRMQNRVNSTEVVNVLGRRLNPVSEWSLLTSECSMQKHWQNSNTRFANLSRDAIDDLAQIKETLSPFDYPAFIQNKI